MLTTDDFLQYSQWMGIATLVFGAITGLSFLFKWGLRFRLVGATGFMGVLTVGLFALSIVPFTRTVIPGAVRFSTVFDSGSTQAVIVVPAEITESQLDATLRQAASDLFSIGRLGRGGEDQLIVRARAIIHPEPGVSELLYVGQAKRSLSERSDENMTIEIFPASFAKLPKPIDTAESSATTSQDS